MGAARLLQMGGSPKRAARPRSGAVGAPTERPRGFGAKPRLFMILKPQPDTAAGLYATDVEQAIAFR